MTKERLEQIAITNYFRSSEDDGWEWKTVADEKVVAVMAEAVNAALEEAAAVLEADDCYWHKSHASLIRDLKVKS